MNDATARGAAAALVLGVTETRISLADQMAGGALDALAPPDRARAQRLALAALRNLARADRVLKPHLRKSPPAPVRAIAASRWRKSSSKRRPPMASSRMR